ncbi:MAG: hypothetical protein ACUVYA_06030 [Planctomycetota bacterium]
MLLASALRLGYRLELAEELLAQAAELPEGPALEVLLALARTPRTMASRHDERF